MGSWSTVYVPSSLWSLEIQKKKKLMQHLLLKHKFVPSVWERSITWILPRATTTATVISSMSWVERVWFTVCKRLPWILVGVPVVINPIILTWLWFQLLLERWGEAEKILGNLGVGELLLHSLNSFNSNNLAWLNVGNKTSCWIMVLHCIVHTPFGGQQQTVKPFNENMGKCLEVDWQGQ